VLSNEIHAIIEQGAKELNIKLPPGTEAAFGTYYDFLKKRGELVNLTAISGVKEVARLHFLDSLALLNASIFINENIFQNAKVIDIGSGAGFPGVPLKLAEPSIRLTLLDSTGKRIDFLSDLCANLDVPATFINKRAEEAAFDLDIREQYNIVVARAVARLNILCELCLPFASPGGLFIAMKSIDIDNELIEAKNAIALMGAKLLGHYDYLISGTEIVHRAVLIRKISNTPEKYPRRFARIQKAPL